MRDGASRGRKVPAQMRLSHALAAFSIPLKVLGWGHHVWQTHVPAFVHPVLKVAVYLDLEPGEICFCVPFISIDTVMQRLGNRFRFAAMKREM